MSQPMPIPGKGALTFTGATCPLCLYLLKYTAAPDYGSYCGTLGCPNCAPPLLEEKPDPVNHPVHYRTGKIETIDFILDQDFGYLAGQCVKYLSRYRWKNKPLEDLRKCQWYLSRLIKNVEEEK